MKALSGVLQSSKNTKEKRRSVCASGRQKARKL